MKKLLRFIYGLIMLFSSILGNSQTDNIAPRRFYFEKDGEPVVLRYYSSHLIEDVHSEITDLIIVVHGTNRNADDYFENMSFALSLRPEKVNTTAIIAPQFITEDEIDFFDLNSDHPYWSSDGWKSGSNSRNESSNPRSIRIPSFEVMDSMIMRSLNSFSNLERLVFTGHSAGGQFTNRYTASSPIFELLCMEHNISSKSIIANPGTYVYMSNRRKKENSIDEFEVPNFNCPDYNEWSFGLEDLFVYPKRSGLNQIKNWYSEREVVYMLGLRDNNPNASTLPRSCRAMSQGSHRLERGRTYFNHIIETFGDEVLERHRKWELEGIGHNNFDVYTSEEGLKELFDTTPLNNCSRTTSQEEVIEFDVNIFPSPTSSLLFLIVDEMLDNIQVSLIDVTNGRVHPFSINSIPQQIDISNLHSGVYSVEIRGKKGIHRQKIVKVK